MGVLLILTAFDPEANPEVSSICEENHCDICKKKDTCEKGWVITCDKIPVTTSLTQFYPRKTSVVNEY